MLVNFYYIFSHITVGSKKKHYFCFNVFLYNFFRGKVFCKQG